MLTPPQGWDEKDERWKRAAPILARPHALRRRGRQWHFDACGKHAGDGAAKANFLGENVWGIWQRHWENMRGHSVTSWLRRAAVCGAAGAEQEQPSSRRSLANRVSGILSSGWHAKDNRFLGSPKLFAAQAWARWRQCHQKNNCDRAGLAELRQTAIRLRMAEAQTTDLDDKKHFLLSLVLAMSSTR